MSLFTMIPTFSPERFSVFRVEMSRLLQLGEYKRNPACRRTREQGYDLLWTATS